MELHSVVEYIRTSIEILMNLKVDSFNQSKSKSKSNTDSLDNSPCLSTARKGDEDNVP